MALTLRGKRNPVYWTNFWISGKHWQICTYTGDKRKARTIEATIKAAKASERYWTSKDVGSSRNAVESVLRALYDDQSNRMELESLWDEYLDAIKVKGLKLSPKWLSSKRFTFERFVEWAARHGMKHLDQIDGTVTKEYALHLQNRPGAAGAKRRRTELSSLGSIWSLVGASHGVTSNPWTPVIPVLVKPEVQRVGFTVDEVQRVLAAASEVHPQWVMACVISLFTGLRYGDVCRLTWSSIDLDGKIIRVKPGKTSDSSGVSVTIPMSSRLFLELSSYRSQQKPISPHDRVLPWLREIGPKGKKRFSYVLKLAGIDHLRYSFHSFRHTFRSTLASVGVSNSIAMKMCGHTTEAMSAHYDHYEYIAEERDAITRMESRMSLTSLAATPVGDTKSPS